MYMYGTNVLQNSGGSVAVVREFLEDICPSSPRQNLEDICVKMLSLVAYMVKSHYYHPTLYIRCQIVVVSKKIIINENI